MATTLAVIPLGLLFDLNYYLFTETMSRNAGIIFVKNHIQLAEPVSTVYYIPKPGFIIIHALY